MTTFGSMVQLAQKMDAAHARQPIADRIWCAEKAVDVLLEKAGPKKAARIFSLYGIPVRVDEEMTGTQFRVEDRNGNILLTGEL